MKYYFLAFISTMLLSCGYLMTKEKYIIEYSNFIEEIKKDRKTYDDKVWSEKDKLHKYYSNSLYNKFGEELSSSEELKIKKLNIIYLACRGRISFQDIISGNLDGELSKVIKELTGIIGELREIYFN